MRILILDNYDSFTFNLWQALSALGRGAVEVVRNDAIDLDGVRARAPDRIVLSPGPGRPELRRWFGVSGEVIRTLGPSVPILGVCLGHQGIVHAYGGRIVHARRPMHGKPSTIERAEDPLFVGLPERFEAMRYHSLVADPESLPGSLRCIAWTAEGEIMAVRHVRHPVVGLQFHPESIGTPLGPRILERFLDAP